MPPPHPAKHRAYMQKVALRSQCLTPHGTASHKTMDSAVPVSDPAACSTLSKVPGCPSVMTFFGQSTEHPYAPVVNEHPSQG